MCKIRTEKYATKKRAVRYRDKYAVAKTNCAVTIQQPEDIQLNCTSHWRFFQDSCKKYEFIFMHKMLLTLGALLYKEI